LKDGRFVQKRSGINGTSNNSVHDIWCPLGSRRYNVFI